MCYSNKSIVRGHNYIHPLVNKISIENTIFVKVPFITLKIQYRRQNFLLEITLKTPLHSKVCLQKLCNGLYLVRRKSEKFGRQM